MTVTYDKRDEYGNVLHVTATDAFGNRRESTTVYDHDGVFPIKVINALRHETTLNYDAVLGVLKSVTDPNGLTTEWFYDSLGRLESEMLPDGANTTIKRTREQIDGVWRMVERTTTTGGADDETIFDSLGRPIETFSFAPQPRGGSQQRIVQYTEYDRLSGQVARQSVPIAEGTADVSAKWNVYAFDALGREIRHVTPWNAVTSTTYNGFLVDSTDPSLKHTVTELDTLGRSVTITDATNGKTKHAYGPFETLAAVTDPGGAITIWKHDAFGRVQHVDEPDRGTTLYRHNGFGDLVESTDALGRVATFDLDALGRVEKRTDKLGAQVLTTSWTWDTASRGIGRLRSVVSPDGVKTYSYNKRGQTESVKLGIGGDEFATRLGYDEFGRVSAIDYPQPLGMEPFGVAYDYDTHGIRIAVRDKVTKDAFWELKGVDNAARYAEESFGNGTKTVRAYHDDKQALKSMTTMLGGSTIQQLSYDWDQQLNLKSRTDARQPMNTAERFKYDALNRLTCVYFGLVENSGAVCDTSYGYAANGNLISKSDVGTLSYGDPQHPHAVTGAQGETFSYNAVGNQITRPGGVSITYTPFDLPRTITQPGKSVSFGYDGDEQRIRKTTSVSETIYFEDLYERIENKSNGAMEHRYSVHSPERVIAIVTRGGAEPGTRYLHTDHLGSTETITNENGAEIEKRSFDAFGARRSPLWGASGGGVPSKTKQGFAGHDEEDEFGLVNMKGRLYDPRIARFTTRDPIIANVYNGQSFAAYSYVLNNPLTYVDPSGFVPDTTIPIINDAIEQTVITQYPDAFVPEPIPDEPNDVLESTNSLRFITDVGTTGDGPNGSGPEPSNGLDVMRDVLGGAAGAYGNDVLETAKGLALFTIFPPGYFAWQGYNFWGGVAGGASEGYKQDGVFGALAGAINVVNPFAHVGFSLAATVDSAEKGDYAKAGENGYHAAKAITAIAFAAIGVAVARGGRAPGAKGHLPNEALVCRGGACTAESFTNGSGITTGAEGKLHGISTQSKAGASIAELSKPFKNGQVGVTTAGEIRRAGGQVVADGTAKNPNHASVSGITAQQAQKLFTPTQPNPVPKSGRGF